MEKEDQEDIGVTLCRVAKEESLGGQANSREEKINA